jgi:alkylation response protein AidB-like acyl-CoA dehydrogenase
MANAAQREQQIAEAEELFGERLDQAGFAKSLYFGEYRSDRLLPYPNLDADTETGEFVGRVGEYCREHVDPVAIDRESLIPQSVIDGLGQLGVLGACLPKEVGGLGLSQTQYCRVLEVLGGHCGSTALFVNAHHSIGPRAIVLFGTPEQRQRWLPKLATGEWLSAFALTEPEAGSDAGNVQTQAQPTEDGAAYVLNGEKRWITNGGLAKVLTVMARTPVEGTDKSQITAFQVTSDTPGFEVVEQRMPKLGVRGTATSRLRFHNMRVPRENVLGPVGKGLRVALTVLDFGRVTFGATCTGAAKFCCARSIEHVNRRVQFGETLSSFELVKQKIARMQAGAFAMESMTYQTAMLIDSGEDDYMLETAMLKVFATDTLWRLLDDTFQLHGGLAYFDDQPFGRMIRDARINSIGEGSNDVLRPFIALVGMRDVGLELQGILQAFSRPLSNLGRLGSFAGKRLERVFANPTVTVRSSLLEKDAALVGKLTGRLGSHVERLLRTYQESILDRQYQLARVADAAMLLYACGCVLSRLDLLVTLPGVDPERKKRELATGRYFLRLAQQRMRRRLASAWDNIDEETTEFANLVLGK